MNVNIWIIQIVSLQKIIYSNKNIFNETHIKLSLLFKNINVLGFRCPLCVILNRGILKQEEISRVRNK